jgi:hypothetical protein
MMVPPGQVSLPQSELCNSSAAEEFLASKIIRQGFALTGKMARFDFQIWKKPACLFAGLEINPSRLGSDTAKL